MTKVQAINYLYYAGMSKEQVESIVSALSQPLDFEKGCWEIDARDGIPHTICGKCGRTATGIIGEDYKFCPYCGSVNTERRYI